MLHDIIDCGNWMGIAAHSAFYLVDKQTHKVSTFHLGKEGDLVNIKKGPPTESGTIHQLLFKDGFLFILSSERGLLKVNIENIESELQVLSHLSDRKLHAPIEMLSGDNGNFWVATGNGLALLDNDLTIKKIFNSQHGLVRTKLSQGISVANGLLFINGENGISIGDPNVLSSSSQPVEVDIRDVIVRGKKENPDQFPHSFSHKENDFQIQTSMPAFGNVEEYQLGHRLRPHNSVWIFGGIEDNHFRYENLAPGHYTFEARSIVDGIEGEITSFSFSIKPPFWKTWWFLLISGVSILGLLTWAYKARIQYKVNQEKLNTRIAKLQNEAIRAQLNPHFIFNALNSIRSLILLDKKESSIEYLGNFSHLVREILSISKETSIPLEREIAFNKKYVEIERLRFSKKLDFIIVVDDDINAEEIAVPPMIMQPFIENAIWHGLLGKAGPAYLRVNIFTQKDNLIIEIDDNGVGRPSKSDLNVKDQQKTRKGFGQLLSQERINTLGKGASLEIIDKVERGRPSGTIVIITIPDKK
ncbi:MAG: histidine kinase [Saprospiraceae bacterium]|nr:histidine kinase [Saprospiraceae bacterium]